MTTQELKDRLNAANVPMPDYKHYVEAIFVAQEAIKRLEKLECAAINAHTVTGITVTGSTWFVTDGPSTAIPGTPQQPLPEPPPQSWRDRPPML